jgi:hypothetical protein
MCYSTGTLHGKWLSSTYPPLMDDHALFLPFQRFSNFIEKIWLTMVAQISNRWQCRPRDEDALSQIFLWMGHAGICRVELEFSAMILRFSQLTRLGRNLLSEFIQKV